MWLLCILIKKSGLHPEDRLLLSVHATLDTCLLTQRGAEHRMNISDQYSDSQRDMRLLHNNTERLPCRCSLLTEDQCSSQVSVTSSSFNILSPPLSRGGRVCPGCRPSVCLCIPGQLTSIVAGDRPRHISTPLTPATEKHINWLHWEPCLVTMAKHTGWRRTKRRRRRAETGQRVHRAVSQGLSFTPFPLLQPRLSFSPRLFLN